MKNVSLYRDRVCFVGAEVLSVDIKIPIKSRHEVIEQYRDMLIVHTNVKIAILGEIIMLF